MRWTSPGAGFAAALALALVFAFALSAAGRESPARTAARPAVQARARRPVVVELFTSQGCSSCPPADRLLARLGEAGGGGVVPLEFHVDYWNGQAWTDPFSSPEWTLRQKAYARRFGETQLYTPQAVVDGASELIGSRESELRAAVAEAASRPGASIALSLEPSETEVRVGARIELPESLRGRRWDLMLAVYETGLSTPVKKGENGGRTLANEYVVRSLRRDGPIEQSASRESRLPLESGWNRARLGVAAFLQDPETLEIRGATARSLGSVAR